MTAVPNIGRWSAERPALAPVPEAPRGRDATRRVKLRSYAEIEPEVTHWLWPDYIPEGALTLLAGREGIGKSLLAVHIAAAVSTGTLPGVEEPRAVVYVAAEDSASRTVVPRLIAAGADRNRVFELCLEVGRDTPGLLTLPEDCAALEDAIREHDAALLILDPLASVIDAVIDTHRDRDLRTALEPLGHLADRTACAVLGLVHFGKAVGRDPMNAVLGSRGFGAVARSAIGVARDTAARDGSCVFSVEKANLGPLDVPALRYLIDTAVVPTPSGDAKTGRLRITGVSPRTVREIMAESLGPSGRSDGDEIVNWLSDLLADANGSLPRVEVMKAAKAEGFSETSVKNAAGRLGVKPGKREGFGGGTRWSLEVAPSEVVAQ